MKRTVFLILALLSPLALFISPLTCAAETIPQAEWKFTAAQVLVDDAYYYLDKTNNLASFSHTKDTIKVEVYTIPEHITYNDTEYTVVAMHNYSSTYNIPKSPMVKTVNYPSTLQLLDGNRMELFPQVTTLVMPASLETITNSFISGYNQIESITFLGQKAPTITSSSFSPQWCKVTVPDASFDDYVAALKKGWTSYQSRYIIVSDKGLQDNVNDFILTVSKAGKLSDEITSYIGNKETIFGLTIYGEINSSDFTTIRSCKNLMRLDLSNAAYSTLPDNAFSGCYFLENLALPDNGITKLPQYAFRYCRGLTSLHIPTTVNEIAVGAFSECFKLNSISIPETVTKIGTNAFEKCYALTEITLPNAIESMGTSMFYNCM